MLLQASIRHHPFLLPVLAVIGAVTSLALGTSHAKQLFPLIGAQGTSALRVGLSALVLLMLWRPWRWPLGRVDAITVLRYGLTLGVMNLLFYMAIRSIPFGVAVAIEFTGPLAVALYYSRRRLDYLWVLLAVLGLLLLLPLGDASAAQLDPVGIAYAAGAAVCWGTYIVFGKRAGHLHAGQTVSLGMLAAAMVVVPVGVAHAGTALLQPQVLLIGLGVAIVSSAIPISLEMYALKRLPRETFGIMASMEPAVAALAAMLFLHEVLDLQQWLAIACIMMASIGSIGAASRQPAGQTRQA
ncbi:EamA family transporter [Corticibacter populi]|uniref:EamA family transporter n=1 Tax=Corticibacter populi TaxID=1550736 RepID=A0A3M6QTK9_9BURK|nr:EamA family transporter [Corticibacter populi]RMX06366.1 EamA family transporter [Corticibacter populi]RZS32089.1 inner membrane transporter RhtA [Corticibacter populi]